MAKYIVSICCILLISLFKADECIDSNIVIANGYGRRVVKNSIAEISMLVESRGRYGQPVQNKVIHRSKKLYDYLRFRRVQKPRTTGVYFFSIYKFNPAGVVGYQGRNTLTFQVPVSRVSSILRGAFSNVKHDAKIIRMAFKAGKKAVEKARHEALREAIMFAKTDAQNMDLPLGGVLQVRVTDSSLPEETVIPTSTSKLREILATHIDVGVTNIQARVEITYEVNQGIQYKSLEVLEE